MASATKVTYGVKKIEFSDVAIDGGPGTTFVALGITKEGTADITEADPESTVFNSEEFDDPYAILRKRGARSLKLTLALPDLDTMALVFGGTVTGIVPNKVWESPPGIMAFNKSVRITPRDGFITTINNGQMTAKLNYKLSKKDDLTVELHVDVLTPTKAGVPSITIGNPV